jgi:glycosyltransferase involved in cell wall biosynthesis
VSQPARSGVVSVVVPSYNHGRFLRSTLDSAFGQSLPPDEVVVVDDGSTDDSREILASCDDPRLVVEFQENRGAHAAINRAIERSRGDYVAILNSDDLFEAARLEHAWGVARTTGALLVCGEVRLIGDDGGAPPAGHDIVRWYETVRATGREARSARAALRDHNLAVTTSNFFVHRALWQILGGFRAWRYVHDYDFILRAVALCPRRVVYEPSLRDVRYRVHGANTISESRDRATAERREMLRRVRAPGARLGGAVRGAVSCRGLATAARATGVPEPLRGAAKASAASGSKTDGAGPRVGVVARSLGVGGLEEVAGLLAEALRAAGVSVDVHCIEAGGAVADRLRSIGVSVSVGDGSAATCARWVREREVEVVSGHFLPVEVSRALFEAGVPVVETLQNTFAWFSETDWERERTRVETVAGMVAVSETVAAYYARRTEYRPGHLIPNAVHPGRATAVPRAFARKSLDLDEDGPVFVAVGRLARQKNLDDLLGAFGLVHRVHPGARLVLAGPSEPEVPLSRLRAHHPEVFASGALRMPGLRGDVGTVLSAADAYVSSAFYEGWSVAASEAAWVGRPLLLSHTGGASELVGSGGGPGAGPRGFVLPNPCGDPLGVDDARIDAAAPELRAAHREEMARAMRSVAEDLEAWRARSGEIRGWARRELGPEVLAERYLSVLRDAVERGRRAPAAPEG